MIWSNICGIPHLTHISLFLVDLSFPFEQMQYHIQWTCALNCVDQQTATKCITSTEMSGRELGPVANDHYNIY